MNIRWRQNVDLAKRLRGLHQALAGYLASGNVSGQAAIYNNLALAYRALGLYRHSNRMAHRAIEIRRRLHDLNSVVNALTIVGGNDTLAGNAASARAHFAEFEAMGSLPEVDADINWARSYPWFAALIAIMDRNGAAAVPLLERALAQVATMKETSFQILLLADLCRAHLLHGDVPAALEASESAIELYGARESRALGAGLSPAHVWWWRHAALLAIRRQPASRQGAGRPPTSCCRKASARSPTRVCVAAISTRSQPIAMIVLAWIAHARRRRYSTKRRTAHLAGEADLRAPFERLVDTGMRLNELHSAAELHEFLVDEVTELSGAERVLLVLDGSSGPQVASSLVPKGEDAGTLLQAVSPLLDEARRTRAASLRYVPESGDALDQRSVLVAPLIVQQRVLGFLYADIDGAFGRFRDTDRDLIGMLAAQAAVALDNVRFAEGLERKVAERTAELEQRASELTLINSIQQGIAAELDFQAIIDLVGDRIREIYNQTDLGIRIYDPDTNLIHFPYTYENGKRIDIESAISCRERIRSPMSCAPARRSSSTRTWRRKSAKYRSFTIPGTEAPKSALFVPLVAGDQARGLINLIDLEREHAYSASDVRLLETLAASMSVALENAQSFEAERQRAAELSIISAVQRALAGELSMQGVYDAVGDKLREVFHGLVRGHSHATTGRPASRAIRTPTTTMSVHSSPRSPCETRASARSPAHRQDAGHQRRHGRGKRAIRRPRCCRGRTGAKIAADRAADGGRPRRAG